jgi:hypothetical protein
MSIGLKSRSRRVSYEGIIGDESAALGAQMTDDLVGSPIERNQVASARRDQA